MLIVDTEKKAQLEDARNYERTQELYVTNAKHSARDSELVADKHTSVANPDVQMGRKMTAEEFANKLRKLNPDIVMEPHPGRFAPKDTMFYKVNKHMAVLNLVVGDKKVYLFPLEGDWMPEWTIMETKSVRVPDHKPTGMWKEVKRPWRREKRGWREVLLMLLHKRLIGLEATERAFGAGDRASWKVLTGKGMVR